jgi:hypothetical protein
MTTRPTPKFTGVDTYKDRLGRYTVRYPSDWHRFDLDSGLDGQLFSPSATNTDTYVASWAQDLEFDVEAKDLDDIVKAFDKGLESLENCQILESNDAVIGNLIKLERFYTYDDNGVTRKRKVWAMYVSHWLMVLTYQGETVEEWEHWYAMANQSFFHFIIPMELWFAADRDLNQKGKTTPKVPRGKVRE